MDQTTALLSLLKGALERGLMTFFSFFIFGSGLSGKYFALLFLIKNNLLGFFFFISYLGLVLPEG